MTASACAAWCWRKAPRIPTSRSWRARSESPPSAKCRTRPASPIPATPSSSTASPARSTYGPRPRSNPPMPSGSRFRARRQAQYSALRDLPCVTRDGQPVELMINAGLTIDLPHIDETGSAGIGLFRTELQFMVSQSLPRTQRSARALSHGAGCRRHQTRHLPHPRYRRRQGAALHGNRGRGKSGARLARDPARARPSRPAARPDPRAVAGRRRPRAEASCSR